MQLFFTSLSALLLIVYSFSACNNGNDATKNKVDFSSIKSSEIKDWVDSTPLLPLARPMPLIISEIEQSFIKYGLVDIKTIDSNIVVDLKYSTTDNFIGIDMYGELNKCYLQPDVAQKLKRCQQFLKTKFPYYNLIVYDAARPRSIQAKMWDTLKIPYQERSKYLSNPKGGSLHNFGAAVDISIIDENNYVIDMGTKYDYFGELAYPREEDRMIEEGKLTHQQLLNRELLRSIMAQGGFFCITTEWWHFNSCSRNEAYTKYSIIE